MRKIVECVPNFSEGRRAEVIDQIVAAIKSVPGVFLLDRESDPDHNRSVITFAGLPERVVEAAVRAAAKATELIDLNQHRGEHPRMGATDVIPFVPILGVTMEDCIQLARECGQRLWRELGIPVYLYERAATRPERENLANLRKGQFEGIRDEIATSPDRWPDFGEPRVHPTAGITAVGARPPLIAYNINLGTNNIDIANKIARAVRHQSGGLRYVKALGFELKDRGIVQVSMNMVNYEGTPLFRAFEMVKREAERYGVAVLGSEIVGLVPQAALNAVADFYLQLENFSEDQILERRLESAISEAGLASSTGHFAELVAKGTPTPGGGSVAAYCGQLAAALGQMVCNLTIGKKKYASVEGRVIQIRAELEKLGSRFSELIEEDATSFDALLEAFRLPRELSERDRRIEEAARRAASVPFEAAQCAISALKLFEELAGIGNANALGDLATGARLAAVTLRSASYNIAANVGFISDRAWADDMSRKIKALVEEGEEIASRIERKL
jgi:glutamate formiminotransferase/formiminotetrahydrofolate cyclodeaminase